MKKAADTAVTIVLFGATGDLAKRKLIPGIFHLFRTELLDDLRVVGTSLDEMSPDEFRDLAQTAIEEFGTRGKAEEQALAEFLKRLDYVGHEQGPEALGGTDR